MIHGNRKARSSMQLRAVVVLGAILVLFMGALLASGVAAVEFAMPWKLVAMLAAGGALIAFQRLRRAA